MKNNYWLRPGGTVPKVEACKSYRYSLHNFAHLEMLVNGQEFTNVCELAFKVCLLQRLVGPFASILFPKYNATLLWETCFRNKHQRKVSETHVVYVWLYCGNSCLVVLIIHFTIIQQYCSIQCLIPDTLILLNVDIPYSPTFDFDPRLEHPILTLNVCG